MRASDKHGGYTYLQLHRCVFNSTQTATSLFVFDYSHFVSIYSSYCNNIYDM
jgi:hypothetical protein